MDEKPKADNEIPGWLNPNKIPGWVYLILFLTGSTGVGVNLFASNKEPAPASIEDIRRIEAQVSGMERKVDTLAELVTQLRITIAVRHPLEKE